MLSVATVAVMLGRRRRQRAGLIGSATLWIRRIQRLALLASIVAGVYRWWQSGPGRPGGGGGGRGGGSGWRAPLGGPKSPAPLSAVATPDDDRQLVGTATAPRESLAPLVDDNGSARAVDVRAWVEPLDGGGCPAGHPVKANDSSGIYHVPGGRFYDRTVAVRCYASPEAAVADGYRPAKA